MIAGDRHERTIREILSVIARTDGCLHSPIDTSLEALGVDSVGMIELVYILEDRFSIEIADEEVVPDNFESIRAITALVERKCASPA